MNSHAHGENQKKLKYVLYLRSQIPVVYEWVSAREDTR
jgi:hypothetical protein